MNTSHSLQSLLNNTATEEEIGLLKQLLASGEISIGGNVSNSVIIQGSENNVQVFQLTPEMLELLGGHQLLGNLERDLNGDEIALGLGRLEAELILRAPVVIPQFQEQARRLRPTLKTNPNALSESARKERLEALAHVNSLCMEALDISFNAVAMGETPPEYEKHCPFRGLESFRVEDREFFFGREELTRKLVGKIQAHSFLAVLGASGSGKSSLVMAGMLPALDLDYAIIRPGANPLDALKSARGKSLLLVDQFEELFTLTRDEKTRADFISALLDSIKRGRVIITLRSDFLGEAGAYRSLSGEIQNHLEIISPMNADELRRAMEGQARWARLEFEADLSQQILDDVAGEPGAMPLLQHALLELWNRRHGRHLRAKEYRAFGGVRQAITSTAEKVYDECTETEREQVRDIFLRLTRLDEGDEGRDTRRRVPLDDLIPSGQDAAVITLLLDKLANARLIVKTVNEEVTEVEVAHEALIRHWERLRLWLNEDSEGLHLHHHLSDSAHQWESRGYEAGELYRGGRLRQAREWIKDHSELLSPLEDDFMKASQNERKRERLRWVAVVGAGILILLMTALAIEGSLYLYAKSLIYQPVDMQDYWVTITAGEFQMGSETGRENERPVHTVYLDAFEIGRYEVTNLQYTQCVQADICKAPNNEFYFDQEYELHPVTDIDWYDAQTFCQWVGGRLPTEAEWEKAARGGLEGKTYPWGNETPTCTVGSPNGANLERDGCPIATMQVGSFSPNGFGLYDMAGNVWEWVNDRYSETFYNQSPHTNPTGPEKGSYRVMRGGSWDNIDSDVRSAYRLQHTPNYSFIYDGFRCARSP